MIGINTSSNFSSFVYFFPPRQSRLQLRRNGTYSFRVDASRILFVPPGEHTHLSTLQGAPGVSRQKAFRRRHYSLTGEFHRNISRETIQDTCVCKASINANTYAGPEPETPTMACIWLSSMITDKPRFENSDETIFTVAKLAVFPPLHAIARLLSQNMACLASL